MKINRLTIEAAIAGSLLVISVLIGLSRVANSAAPIGLSRPAPDTATIDRLTRADDVALPIGPQATADITGTNGMLVAVDLLLSQPYYDVDLPLVLK